MSSGGTVPTEEDRKQEVDLVLGLAKKLQALSASPGGSGHADTLKGFAASATGYAARIKKAPTPEQGVAIANEIAKKRAQWQELIDMLELAAQLENIDDQDVADDTPLAEEDIESMEGIEEAIQEAEGQIRRTAENLRGLSERGGTAVFNIIGLLAKEAEGLLKDFVSAEKKLQKIEVFTRFEEAKGKWQVRMESIHKHVAAEGGDTMGAVAGSEADDAEEVSEVQEVAEIAEVDAGDAACETADDNTYASCMDVLGSSSGGFGQFSPAFANFGSFGAGGCAISK